MTDLVILSRRSIENHSISCKNVAKVLRVIDIYKTLEGFDNICEDLSARCQQFISDNMRTAQDVFNLLATANEDEDDLDKAAETELLVKLLRDTAKCRNCKMHPTECLNGEKVTYDNMIAGVHDILFIHQLSIFFHLLSIDPGGKQRIKANTTFQSLSNWTTIEKTVGHISAFSKEDSVHYYTPGQLISLSLPQK